MLTSLILTFTIATEVTLPRDLGRASHGLLFRLLQPQNPALTELLHTPKTPRPFTCSNVFGGRRENANLRIAPNDALWLRYTGLNAEMTRALTQISQTPPTTIELDKVNFRITGATLDEKQHPRATQTTYEALAAPHLMSRESPNRHVDFKFISPMAFRSRGQHLPLPLPSSVFGSLLDKWNAFAPITLPEDFKRFADECIALSQFRGRTRVLRAKDLGAQVGFIGYATFVATHGDRYWLSLFNILADFARFAGVGYQTTQGMGQVRRI